jgi:hypothetical protein
VAKPVCVDKHGQGKIGRVSVVYQLNAVPGIVSDKKNCQDGPDHDKGKGNDCQKRNKKDK